MCVLALLGNAAELLCIDCTMLAADQDAFAIESYKRETRRPGNRGFNDEVSAS